MISCVVSDLDGTLLNGAGEISKRSKDALLALKKKGIPFVVATGRDIKSASAIFEGFLQEDYIVLNGGMTYISNQLVHECHLSNDCLKQIDALLASYQIPYIYFTQRGVVSTNVKVTHQHFVDALKRSGMSDAEIEQMLSGEGFGNYASEVSSLEELWSQGYIVYKCEFYTKDELQYQEIYQKLAKMKDISISGWVSFNMELTPKLANKGEALMRYLKEKRIDPGEVVVLGDSMNDATMMKVVNHSIAMKNASDSIKQLAKYTLEYGHREDGVAYVIEKIIERSNGEENGK